MSAAPRYHSYEIRLTPAMRGFTIREDRALDVVHAIAEAAASRSLRAFVRMPSPGQPVAPFLPVDAMHASGGEGLDVAATVRAFLDSLPWVAEVEILGTDRLTS